MRRGCRLGSTKRWRGFCHGCKHYDAEVETRYDRGAKSLCDHCYGKGHS